MTEAKKKGNGLAITALVLSSVFFLPIIPFFGLVLGIIALTTGRSKPMSIVAICLGAFFTLMTGIYAFPYDDYGASNQSSDHTCAGATQLDITFCPRG